MTSVDFALVETLTDQRSNEKTYTLRVTNRGAEAVRIHAVTPRLPESVRLIEIRDTSLVGTHKRRNDLSTDLSILVRDQLLVSSKTYRDQISSRITEVYTAAMNPFGRLLEALMRRPISNHAREQALRAWTFRIDDVEDAQDAKKRFFVETDPLLLSIFDAKLKQFERAEADLDGSSSKEELASVSPSSFFAVSYSLQFPRSHLESRKYVIAVDVTYSTSVSQRLLGNASESIVISPRPFFLSVIAMIASLLGLIVSLTFNVASTSPTMNTLSLPDLWTSLQGVRSLSAAALALVVYNIYEFLDFGDKLKMGVGWRSALTVGALCGAFNQRIITALTTLVG